jgi:acyl-coenzyme A synthetase/AMP-(fatty) acid ligase
LSALAEQVSGTAGAPALLWRDGALSHGELRALAGGAAACLDELGVATGERVAVWGRKSPATIALVLGCLSSGRPVLIPSRDIRRVVLDDLLERAEVGRLLVTEPLDGGTLVEPAAGAPPTSAPAGPPRDDDVALMLTTSGSTGFPKVVPLSHGAIRRFASWASGRFDIGAGTRVLSYCGLNFDLSLLEVWTTLRRGGCVVLVDQERATRGGPLLDLVNAHDVEVVQGVPLLHGLLLDAAGGRTAPSVKHAIVTGDAAPAGLIEQLPDLFQNACLYNVYGCTETNDSFVHEIDRATARAGAPVALGRPLPGVSALIVGDDGVVRSGAGSGELWVSTPFQTCGYLGGGAPAGAFAPDPLGASGRSYFRSGDIVRRDAAGTTFLEGRTDFQVKVRGSRVNLQEVEQTLLEDPAVSEAAVVAFDDTLAGKRLHAVVRRRGGAELSTLELRTQCSRRLTRAAIPSIIEIQDEPLPKTTTGKVDRTAVKRCAGGGSNG